MAEIVKRELGEEATLIKFDLQLFASSDSGEKTEQPTPRKLKKARSEGQVFKSTDLISGVSILFAAISVGFVGPYVLGEVAKLFIVVFSTFIPYSSEMFLDANLEGIILVSFATFLKVFVVFSSVMLVAALLSNYLQVGFIMSSKPMQFDLKKLDPIKGLKKIFSKKGLLEVVKFLFKFAIVLGMVAWEFKRRIINYSMLIMMTPEAAFSQGLEWLSGLFMRIAAVLILLSVVDFYFQKQFWLSDMKMTKKEVKDEYKTVEGDPLLKGKIRERQRQISMNSMLREVEKATVVINNPTHVSVCLQYDLGMVAPVVVAMGRDHVAFKIREVAKERGIPMVEDKPIARGLYNDAEIGEFIPEQYLSAVAKIIAYVISLDD